MMEGIEKKEVQENQERQEIFSQAVRAGKRTYFFDVKSTKRNDYYLTITESKKRFNKDGRYFFEKHKIFLYKEDFDKFIEGLHTTIDYIKSEAPEPLELIRDTEEEMDTENITETAVSDEYTQVEFEDLNEA